MERLKTCNCFLKLPYRSLAHQLNNNETSKRGHKSPRLAFDLGRYLYCIEGECIYKNTPAICSLSDRLIPLNGLMLTDLLSPFASVSSSTWSSLDVCFKQKTAWPNMLWQFEVSKGLDFGLQIWQQGALSKGKQPKLSGLCCECVISVSTHSNEGDSDHDNHVQT